MMGTRLSLQIYVMKMAPHWEKMVGDRMLQCMWQIMQTVKEQKYEGLVFDKEKFLIEILFTKAGNFNRNWHCSAINTCFEIGLRTSQSKVARKVQAEK